MGRATDPWRAAKTRIRCVASPVSRYLPRRGYPPTQASRTFLRNRKIAIGTIGLGAVGRLSDELLALVRGWIARVVRCATKGQDGIPCRLVEPSSTFTVSLEGLPDTQAAGIHEFCTTNRYRAHAEATHNSCKAIVLHVAAQVRPPLATAIADLEQRRHVYLDERRETAALDPRQSSRRRGQRASTSNAPIRLRFRSERQARRAGLCDIIRHCAASPRPAPGPVLAP
jgi:hypothetical protein